MPTNQIRVLPVHAYPARKFACGTKVSACHREKIDFLPEWESIPTVEIDFYRSGKLIFTTVEID